MHLHLSIMTKRNAPNKAVAARPGSTNLIQVLEKVVPFLFRKKSGTKKTQTITKKLHAQPRVVRHTTAPTRKTKKTVKKSAVSAKKKKSLRHAVAAPVAQKKVTTSIKQPKGRFVLQDEQPETDVKAVKAELLADSESDAFLKKVSLRKNSDSSETKKISTWSILTTPLSFGVFSKKTDAPKAAPLSAKDIANDSFLKRVQKKDPSAVVGTAVDPDEFEAEKITGVKSDEIPESLDDLAHGEPAKNVKSAERPKGRILSAEDLRRETREAKEAAQRVEKEVREIKEELRSNGSEKPAESVKDEKQVGKQEEERVPDAVVNKNRIVPKSGFQKFVSGIGYIGLGKERMQFIQNLATMLNAGLPLIDAIHTLQMETRVKPMKKLLQRILDAVENGSPLWRAMDAQSFFTPHAIALVRIGEEAGNLSENMAYLAQQDEKDHELKSKVKMAMIYPSIVLTIMAIIIVVLGMFVLPNLIGVLTSLNVPLPLVTRIVIRISNLFTEYGAVAIPGSLAGLVVLMILNKYTGLKVVVQWLTFRVPGVGALAREATIARFGVILGGLLKAGVPVTEAMHSLVEVTTIVSYRKLYSRMLDHITVGDSFSRTFESLKESKKLIPPSVQQLVITGEKSGALADIMIKISEIYDKKASETAQKLPIILEPMLLLFIGSLVGTIAFAILVPIYSIVGNVGR